MFEDVVDDLPFGTHGETRTAGTRTPRAIQVERPARPGLLGRREKFVRRAGRRRHVVEDAAMFVVGDQQRRFLQTGTDDRHVDRCDESLARAHVMVGMLITRDQTVMIRVVRLHERETGSRSRTVRENCS